MSASISFLISFSRSDRLTPQKLLRGSKHSIPAWSSLGASSRTQAIRNFALWDPRCRLTIIPSSSCVRSPPSRAPISVMSTVYARRVTLSVETFTGKTIFLRGDFRFSSIKRLCRGTGSRESYQSYGCSRVARAYSADDRITMTTKRRPLSLSRRHGFSSSSRSRLRHFTSLRPPLGRVHLIRN